MIWFIGIFYYYYWNSCGFLLYLWIISHSILTNLMVLGMIEFKFCRVLDKNLYALNKILRYNSPQYSASSLHRYVLTINTHPHCYGLHCDKLLTRYVTIFAIVRHSPLINWQILNKNFLHIQYNTNSKGKLSMLSL